MHHRQIQGVMQMADTAAVRTTEAFYSHEALSDASSDLALQILSGSGDEDLAKTGMRQQVVDMPAFS
jgi:hypothetical protein